MSETFYWENEVRNNEVDLQGIVNNSNYFVYMAHARHSQLKGLGVDFAKYHEEGYDLVLCSSHIEYKAPLVSGDWFVCSSKVELMGKIRFKFTQEVRRKSDDKLMATGEYIATCITSNGRPKIPQSLKDALGI